MKKIAMVNQRYGLEVNGGSEFYTRTIAERLNRYYDLEVLTTCALDYSTWDNYYQETIDDVNGVKVRRFSVERPRDQACFNEVNKNLLTERLGDKEYEDLWIDEQGPYCPKLIEYIEQNKARYDVFIFVTYLYYLTARGLPIVAEKSILIPTAHDEPYIHISAYRKIFTKPSAIVYLTEAEREIVQTKFRNKNVPSEVIGTGVDVPADVDGLRFKRRYAVDNYILYVGRIDDGKNCPELFEYFLRYKENHPGDLKLVLMGKEEIPIPEHEDILSLGFVSDQDKADGMAGAELLVLPSMYESLSLVVLEAMALGTPVIVNGKCTVLVDHCRKSNAGLYYEGYYEFDLALEYLINNEIARVLMRRNGINYVDNNYCWLKVMEKYKRMIDDVINY